MRQDGRSIRWSLGEHLPVRAAEAWKKAAQAVSTGDRSLLHRTYMARLDWNAGEGTRRGTLLHTAAKRPHWRVLAMVLGRSGIQLNVRNAAGRTPVMLAAAAGLERNLAELVTAGAAIGLQDNRGATALHLAAAAGREAVVRMLLLLGADPRALNADGKRPQEVVSAGGGWGGGGRQVGWTRGPIAAITQRAGGGGGGGGRRGGGRRAGGLAGWLDDADPSQQTHSVQEVRGGGGIMPAPSSSPRFRASALGCSVHTLL
jgi:hypothetical protein